MTKITVFLIFLIVNETEFTCHRRNKQGRCNAIGIIIVSVTAFLEHNLSNGNS